MCLPNLFNLKSPKVIIPPAPAIPRSPTPLPELKTPELGSTETTRRPRGRQLLKAIRRSQTNPAAPIGAAAGTSASPLGLIGPSGV